MAGEGNTHQSGGPPPDEAAAIAACQKGDRDAYELLVRRYAARALGVARRILRDAALAEDASQEAFVRAFRAIGGFSLSEPFYPWFYRILRNCCLTAAERRLRRERSLDEQVSPPPSGPWGDPPAAAARSEARENIAAAMARLSEPHREILQMAHFDALSYREIAACLDVPVGTVMSRLWAARQALRKMLQELYG